MPLETTHESATLHVTGEAVYVDDIPLTGRALVGKVVYSPYAHARIQSADVRAARHVQGVHAILAAADIPGKNQMGPVVKDELCLAVGEVTFIGQAILLIAAETEEQCREAEQRIHMEFEQREAILDIETAMANGSLLGAPRTMVRGNVESALTSARHRMSGELRTGAQEHWYLESQVCLCLPGEGNEISVYSSTQHPSETQALVAEVLGIRKNDVVVEVRRMGGAFGGKETQANHTACWTALLCKATGRPVKIRLFRDDDMIMTGKRHRYMTRYDTGFDDDGRISAIRFELNGDGGAATDLSFAILERAMLHVDNAYYVPNLSVAGSVWKTNLPSNTAMRGFGAPQAMAAMETIIDRIARLLHLDAAEVRRRNFYGDAPRNITHYGQPVEDNRLQMIYDRLKESADYDARRREVNEFNAGHEFLKKGLAMTPVKFGISFTTTYLNQAGALVNIYRDGSVLVNHGGTEMGQGLHTKILQIASHELGVPLERIRVNATSTSKVPNTSATAASSGTDLNGMAVKIAIDTLKQRIAASFAGYFSEGNDDATDTSAIRFENNEIFDSTHSERRIGFAEAMNLMNLRQISLSATGFYRAPSIGWDKEAGKGRPFLYYAFGMAVTEVLVDLLTGRHTILRTDILHDVGDSLNPAIDRGQVEGGYVQGVGWCTTEEIRWDDQGHLLTHSPDTYKIPAIRDVPKDFRVALLQGAPNPLAIHNSKAVAEPPFMFGLSAWLAIKDAISAAGNHTVEPEFSLPATNEIIVLSYEHLKQRLARRDVSTLVAE